MHGYELKRRVVRPSLATVSNNSLYPALRRFEELGAVTVTVEQQEGRPARRTYRLTEAGAALLLERASVLPAEKAASDDEFAVRVALFDDVAPEARVAILTERLAALDAKLATARELAPEHADPRPGGSRERAASRRVDVLEDDRRWVAGLLVEEGGTPRPPGASRPQRVGPSPW